MIYVPTFISYSICFRMSEDKVLVIKQRGFLLPSMDPVNLTIVWNKASLLCHLETLEDEIRSQTQLYYDLLDSVFSKKLISIQILYNAITVLLEHIDINADIKVLLVLSFIPFTTKPSHMSEKNHMDGSPITQSCIGALQLNLPKQ